MIIIPGSYDDCSMVPSDLPHVTGSTPRPRTEVVTEHGPQTTTVTAPPAHHVQRGHVGGKGGVLVARPVREVRQHAPRVGVRVVGVDDVAGVVVDTQQVRLTSTPHTPTKRIITDTSRLAN